MRRRGHRIACLLTAALLAFPGAAWGQSAGDDQYEDPFAPEPGQTGGGGSSQDDGGGSSGGGSSGGGSSGGGTTGTQPAPAAQSETVPATTAQAPDGSQQLPRTGADAGLIALGGAVLLVAGMILRVRLSAPAERRAGAGLSAPAQRHAGAGLSGPGPSRR